MLNYGIKLKSWKTIEELCYETEDSSLGQDSIAFDKEVLKQHGFFDDGVRLVDVLFDSEDSFYAYKVQSNTGAKTYIHLDWIASFNGSPTIAHKIVEDTLLIVSRKYVFNKNTGELLEKSTMPLCDCGALGTITMHDGGLLCSKCNDELTMPKNYSYKPDTFEFIGDQLSADKDTPVWYGLEVEVATDKTKLGKYMYEHRHGVYLKSDGSIEGAGHRVEIVSMPHSFNALMHKDSWLSKIDALPTANTKANGCHVHISRTAFKDDKHYALFYFLLHKMNKIATKVGGRELTNYCQLKPSGKVHNKTKDGIGDGSRQVYLNERNKDTVEARFFKSTTNVTNLRAYVQLLESMIKYTRYHATTVTSKGWFEYTTKKSKKYAELLSVLGDIDISSLDHYITYKEPTIIVKQFEDCTMKDLINMVKIEVRGDNLQYTFSALYNNNGTPCLELRNVRGSLDNHPTLEIANVTIEEE